MGFRKDAWATCWEIQAKSDTMTQVRLSTSRKDKQSGEYVQDWSGFVAFVGSANAKKAAGLEPKTRIKLGDVEETSRYDKEKKTTYYNRWCYNFETQEDGDDPFVLASEPEPGTGKGKSKKTLPF